MDTKYVDNLVRLMDDTVDSYPPGGDLPGLNLTCMLRHACDMRNWDDVWLFVTDIYRMDHTGMRYCRDDMERWMKEKVEPLFRFENPHLPNKKENAPRVAVDIVCRAVFRHRFESARIPKEVHDALEVYRTVFDVNEYLDKVTDEQIAAFSGLCTEYMEKAEPFGAIMNDSEMDLSMLLMFKSAGIDDSVAQAIFPRNFLVRISGGDRSIKVRCFGKVIRRV